MHATIFTALLAVMFFSSRPPAAAECLISTLRVTGNNNLFALACRCDGRREFLGRSVRLLEPDTPDTVAQERLTVRCIERRKPGMARACRRSSQAFERRASEVLRECMERRPSNPSRAGNRPFTFRRDSCVTDFRELDVERMEALLVCGCPQRPGYIVNTGVIQFITNDSPIGSGQEQRALQRCTAQARTHLNDACRNHPRRFALRGAQSFNVCCKRIRRRFDLSKLSCQAIVPDDISELGLTFA